MIAIISILIFIFLLILIIFLRIKNSKFEAKPTDLALAMLITVLFLFVTGKLKTIEFGGLKINSAFIKASESAITEQITRPLPIKMTSRAMKALLIIPPYYLKRKEALEFILGQGDYSGNAIMVYLSTLITNPNFNYIIISKKDGSFFGLADGRIIFNLFQSGDYKVDNFAEWLNKSNEGELLKLPSFKPSNYAVQDKLTDKVQALQKMEFLDLDTLPVVNDIGDFVGIVDRSRLTASLLIDVSQQLKNK